jgi:plastocyanin
VSEAELVQAYLDGQITRRVFIRRLVAMGITFTAAVSYASILRSSPAAAGTPSNDFYDLYDFYCDPAHHDLFTVTARDDNTFAPKGVVLTPGDRVRWNAPGSNQQIHTVTDTTGMNLYNGFLPPGTSFTFQFKAAGQYAYKSTRQNDPGMTGTVTVRPVVQPVAGTSGTRFTLAWACSTAPAGFVYDVQLKRPSGSWQTFAQGTTERLMSFVVNRTGPYGVRARLRKLSNNKASGYAATPFFVGPSS